MIFGNQHDLASQGSHADASSLPRMMLLSQAARLGMCRLTGALLGSTALVGIIVSTPAVAGSLSWSGGTSTDWTDPTNWSTNTAPTSADSVSIDTGAINVPIIDGKVANSGSVTVGINGTADLEIQNGGTLTSGQGILGSLAGSHGFAIVTNTGSKWDLGLSELDVGFAGTGKLTISNGATVTDQKGSIGRAASGSGEVDVTSGGVWTNNGSLLVGDTGTGALVISNGGQVTDSFGIISGDPNATGTVTVDGAGSKWISAAGLSVAQFGTGTLTVSSSGQVLTSGAVEVAGSTAAVGTVTVDGANSNLTVGSTFDIGGLGDGTLTIWNGGTVSSGSANLAANLGAKGDAVVAGNGSEWQITTGLWVGNAGSGTLLISNRGRVDDSLAFIGNVAGSTGTVTVDGAGSFWNNTGSLTVGANGTGVLKLQNGGGVHAASANVGDGSGAGAIIVDGSSSDLTVDGALKIGSIDSGELTISNGGRVNAGAAWIGDTAASKGNATVTGTNSTWSMTGTLYVGDAGRGSLLIEKRGDVESGAAAVGVAANAAGAVTVDDSIWNAAGDIDIGVAGQGDVTVQNGGILYSGNGVLGDLSGSVGTITVDGIAAGGAKSAWIAASLSIGRDGTGSLSILNAAKVESGKTFIGEKLGSGSVAVDGAGSTWKDSDALVVGGEGTGSLFLQTGGQVSNTDASIGNKAGSDGSVKVDGAGSKWINTGHLTIGDGGTGGLSIGAGGVVTNTYAAIGAVAGSSGTVEVSGAGATWTNNGSLQVGVAGTGKLDIANGGAVTSTLTSIGYGAGSQGAASVSGSGSTWDTDKLSVGYHGLGQLTISNGGAVSDTMGVLSEFDDGKGTATVTGTGSTWTNSGAFFVGGAGEGELTVSNGGRVINTYGFIGSPATAKGTAIVTGAGSSWASSADLTIGNIGDGTLTISDQGTVAASGVVALALNTGSTGTLNIGTDPSSAAAAPGTLDTPTVQFGQGSGTINFNHTGSKFVFTPVITGSGTINQIAGETILDANADDSGFTGPTNVSGGRLAVNGSLAGSTVSVASGGILGGSGTVGSIDAQSGGIVAPGNSIGTLKVAGNVLFSPTSIYQVEANAAGQADKIAATGKATINGGMVKVLAETGSYSAATTYTILTAGGGVTGSFADVTSDLAFLDPNLSYDASSVYLTLSRNSVSFASAGTTFNQIATAQGVESLGSGNAVYDAVTGLSTAEAQSAFDDLSGEIHASAKTALIDESRFIRGAANNRIRQAFGDASTTSAIPVMAYGPGGPEAAPASTDRFAVWAQGFGARDDFDGDGNAAELTSYVGGFFIGGDAVVTDDWRLGLATGYSHSKLDSDERASSADVSSYTLAAYTGTQMGALGLRFGAANTRHNIDTSRCTDIGALSEQAEASYDARTAQAFGEAGYTVTYGDAAFEPFANLAYVNLHTDGYTESGTAGLSSRSSNSDVTFTTVGLNASTGFDLGGIRATAGGTVGWRHAFGDTTPFATQAFAGSDFFTVAGTAIAEDALVLGAAFGLDLTAGSRLEIGYSGQIGDGVQDHAANATLSVRF